MSNTKAVDSSKPNIVMVRNTFRQLRKLLDLEEKLTVLLVERGDTDMSQEVTDLIAAFDAATDRVAARIAALIAKSGLTAEEKAAFTAEVTKLNTLGEDPANPVPPGI